jgi:hypothetical protein
MHRHAVKRNKLINPALARTPLAKPRGPLMRLFSMIGWMIAPSDEPVATNVITSVRLRRKWCEIIAMLGIYMSPDAIPKPKPWDKNI